MNIPPNPLRDKRSFCQLFPSACMYVRVHALAPDVWVRIHCQLEVSDLCIWFNATMMDDMVIRGLPIGLGPSYLAVKVNGYEAHNRVATWWAHWNTSCVPWRHPSYRMSHSREAPVVGPQPRERPTQLQQYAHSCVQHLDGCHGMAGSVIVNRIVHAFFLAAAPKRQLMNVLIGCYFRR